MTLSMKSHPLDNIDIQHDYREINIFPSHLLGCQSQTAFCLQHGFPNVSEHPCLSLHLQPTVRKKQLYLCARGITLVHP